MNQTTTYKFVTRNDGEMFEYKILQFQIVTAGEVGEEAEEIEFAPIESPIEAPIENPAVPVEEPVGAPA